MIEVVRQNMKDVSDFKNYLQNSLTTIEKEGVDISYKLPKSFKDVIDSYYINFYRELLIETTEYEDKYKAFLGDFEHMIKESK